MPSEQPKGFVAGLILGGGLVYLIHRVAARCEQAETEEPLDRKGWIACRFREWLDCARQGGLDRRLNLKHAHQIDTYILARFLLALCLLVAFGWIYDYLDPVPPAWWAVGMFAAIAILIIVTPTHRRYLFVAVSLGIAVWLLGLHAAPSIGPWEPIAFIFLGLVLLREMMIARARDHLFQQPEDRRGFAIRRSLILAVINVGEAIVIFAILYSAIAILSPGSFPDKHGESMRGILDALWFSLATMFTADIGIKYDGWARVCAAAQLSVALFFFAGILATLTGYLTSGSVGMQRGGGGQNEGAERAEESRD